MESELLSRDAEVLDLKFRAEAAEAESQRIRKRLSDFETLEMIASRVRGVNPHRVAHELKSKPSAAQETGESNRDLQRVIETLKRVVDKQKGEIDRLRRLGGRDEEGGEARGSEGPGRRNLMADREHLQREIRSLRAQVQNLELDAQQGESARRELVSKEAEIAV